MKPRLKMICGRTTAKGSTCTKEAKDSLGCFFHSENYAQERARNSSKGGKLGGRGRASFSRELKNVRELVEMIIELLAYDRLAPHLDYRMRDLLQLLKCYITLAQYEVRTAQADVIEARHANTARELIDTQDIRARVEALVYEDADEHDEQHDPTRGGAT